MSYLFLRAYSSAVTIMAVLRIVTLAKTAVATEQKNIQISVGQEQKGKTLATDLTSDFIKHDNFYVLEEIVFSKKFH